MCFLCFDPLLCVEAFNSISWFLSGWAEMVEPSWDNCPGCIWTRCTAPFMSKRLTAAPDQIYKIIYSARAQSTTLCQSSWRWRQIKKRLFIAHLSLFVRVVCWWGWKIRVTNDVSVVIISAELVALWSTLSTLDWSPGCLNNYFNVMLVFVFDSLWREAPLKPSVCSTKRFLISPKKQKMHALLRFLQIWSCGKICHNYPGGVTPICFPGHSMWFAVGHIWSKYFEKDHRTTCFRWKKIWNLVSKLLCDNLHSRCCRGVRKWDLIVLRSSSPLHSAEKTLSGGKLPQVPSS